VSGAGFTEAVRTWWAQVRLIGTDLIGPGQQARSLAQPRNVGTPSFVR
jgi:hypothetical protein